MENTHSILIFATDIKTQQGKNLISKALDEMAEIISWSIDQEDKDRVLRIVCTQLSPDEIIELVTNHNFKCKELE